MNNPIVQREYIGALRTRWALAMQVGAAFVFALLVLIRWPTDARVDLAGERAEQVFRVFGYGLLGAMLLLVPVFPATTIVREKIQGTLALLLNSPLTNWGIYYGKLLGVVGFAVLPLVVSLPAAAACYAMGGIDLIGDIGALYFILLLVVVQYAALGLLVSSRASTTVSAMRITYGLVLAMAVLSLGPYQFMQGRPPGLLLNAATWLRSLSPIPAVMDVLGQRDIAAQGIFSQGGDIWRFMVLALLTTAAFMIATIVRLKQTMFDRPRDQGVITDDRGAGGRAVRRMVYLIDPQRRKSAIARWVNPVMIKEFRSRRFGRSHWMLRLVAVCALISLGLTYVATAGTLDWGVETIGGIMVVLQVALIVFIAPSLAAGLISSEHEVGSWTLLRMTPMSAGTIIRGKLASCTWTMLLILLATLPGYALMMVIKPILRQQVLYVLFSLVLTAAFAIILSTTISSFFRRTAPATITAYAILIGLCGGTTLIWLGRDAPFGHAVVENALRFNPMLAALSIIETPGFENYNLVPANWWIIGGATLLLLVVLHIQTWRLTRPE